MTYNLGRLTLNDLVLTAGFHREMSEGGTHNEFRNINKLASHIVQKNQNQKTVLIGLHSVTRAKTLQILFLRTSINIDFSFTFISGYTQSIWN